MSLGGQTLMVGIAMNITLFRIATLMDHMVLAGIPAGGALLIMPMRGMTHQQRVVHAVVESTVRQ